MQMSAVPPETLLVAFLALVFGAIVYIILGGSDRSSTEASKEHLAYLKRDAEEFVARARRGLTPIATRLILKGDEHAVLEENSTLLESRAFRVWGGGGTRIGRFYVGGGASESEQRLKQIDDGTLTLTTKRLIFDGSSENRNVQLSQVLSVSPWTDAIEVSTQRAKSQIYRVRNPFIWMLEWWTKRSLPPSSGAMKP